MQKGLQLTELCRTTKSFAKWGLHVIEMFLLRIPSSGIAGMRISWKFKQHLSMNGLICWIQIFLHFSSKKIWTIWVWNWVRRITHRRSYSLLLLPLLDETCNVISMWVTSNFWHVTFFNINNSNNMAALPACNTHTHAHPHTHTRWYWDRYAAKRKHYKKSRKWSE